MYSFEQLEKECNECNKCNLHVTRNKVVIERGNRNSNILFVGEGPGATEDRTGIAFTGNAGKLLDLALASIGIEKDNIYICNIIKCRPPNNQNPTKEQVKMCLPYLKRQIELVNPKVIVLLGSVALRSLIDENLSITRERGKWLKYEEIDVMPTYHPAALFRDESKKIHMWKDIKLAWIKIKK